MYRHKVIGSVCCAVVILWLTGTAAAQTIVYNNFGSNHEGWDYTYTTGWTVAGVNVPNQYGVEQAMSFTSTADGAVSDIWVAFFYVPFSSMPDTVTIKLVRNPNGLPPDPMDVMEQWVITNFESWTQWTPPIHLAGAGSSHLQAGEDYWLWAVGGETTWCGWCLNVDPALTCPHTLRREGENWLPLGNETASAFRVDVNTEPTVSITLTPSVTPILIPISGGSFQFDAAITNNTGFLTPVQAWISVQLPVGLWYGPVLGPVSMTLPANQSVTRQRTQTVPGSAPAGLYTYRGWVGSYPHAPLDSSSFTFMKLGTGNGPPVTGEWLNTGAEFGETEIPISTHNSAYLSPLYPNPFNRTATISYELQAAGHVSLKVYDTAGRLVTTLVNSWREAGTHEVTFDGSKLASGIYLYTLTFGQQHATGKMVLLK
jgi:hypothetical protein